LELDYPPGAPLTASAATSCFEGTFATASSFFCDSAGICEAAEVLWSRQSSNGEFTEAASRRCAVRSIVVVVEVVVGIVDKTGSFDWTSYVLRNNQPSYRENDRSKASIAVDTAK
jgi:hypothetical protein